MTNQLVTKAAFKELDNDYSFFNDQVRDEVACLLGKVLKTCRMIARPSLWIG